MTDRGVRDDYIKRIGLTHDPFVTPVAEQELSRVKDIFYSYYSPPSPDVNQEELINRLRYPQHAFVFGRPGSGKSMLRLTLEADCRTVLDGTLAITHILGEDIGDPLTPDQHGVRLAQALTIDMTLAIIEQFNPLDPFPTEKQIRVLQRQIPSGGEQLQRFLRRLIEKLDQNILDPAWGISKDWVILGRAPVKYVGGSKELEKFLKNLLLDTNTEQMVGWDAFWQGLEAAQAWGFERFFVLIDGVDAKSRSQDTMMALVAPLLKLMQQSKNNNVSLKFFLPLKLEKLLKKQIRSDYGDLYSKAFFPIMKWDDKALQQLLAQRFRAASPHSGPHYTGLDNLATPELNLDKNVIRAAGKSPRRLLDIINELIDIHVTRDPDSLTFDREDWELYRQKTKKGTYT